jgi:hypothetical protein
MCSLFKFRTWHARRVVCTKEKMYFSRMSANNLIDMIPLHEISSVSEMKDFERITSSSDLSNPSFNWRMSKSTKALDCENNSGAVEKGCENQSGSFLQIKTTTDGFNSGRVYYLQTRSLEQCQTIVQELTRAVERAKAKIENLPLFRSTQAKLKIIYNTMTFQIMVAFLIITVRISV